MKNANLSLVGSDMQEVMHMLFGYLRDTEEEEAPIYALVNKAVNDLYDSVKAGTDLNSSLSKARCAFDGSDDILEELRQLNFFKFLDKALKMRNRKNSTVLNINFARI